MVVLSYLTDSFDFEEKFAKIPMFWKFSDPILRTILIQFLQTWNQSTHYAWREAHCPEMIEHGLVHSRNLFMIANRLFHDNDNLIEHLNDGEIALFTLSLWLHDVSMSKLLFSIQAVDLEDLNGFLTGYDLAPTGKIILKSLEEITPFWVRMHHQLLSKYIIKKNCDSLAFGSFDDEHFREVLGKLCFFHSSKVRLLADEKVKKYYNIDPVISQYKGFEKYSIGNTPYKINLLYLAALLRFVDGCDQTKRRLISEGNAQQHLRRNRAVRDQILSKIKTKVNPDDVPKIMSFSPVSEETNHSTDLSESFEHFREKYPDFKPDFDELEIICYYRRNMDYKKSVKDIYFNEGSIILSLPDDRLKSSEDRVKKDILNELIIIKEILKYPPNTSDDIGIPYCKDHVYDESSFEHKQYVDDEEYEVVEYEIYQRKGEQGSGYTIVESLAQKAHEDYIKKQRAEGDTVLKNPNLHLWNRLTNDSRESNRKRPVRDYEYIQEIGCRLIPSFGGNIQSNFSFTGDELEKLAEKEHNNWVNDKCTDGWIFGIQKDGPKKTHPCLIPWSKLPEGDREKDRQIIRNIPLEFKEMNLEIQRIT